MKKWTMAVLAVSGMLSGALSPAADFDGNGRAEPTIFRNSQCKWVAYGVTNFYFGNSADQVLCDDYDGDGRSDAAAYRPSESMWTVRGVTRVWFGNTGDVAVSGGGGDGAFDYTVKPGDADDLKRALESDVYLSVFIPSATYNVNETITVDHVRRISGEEGGGAVIAFGDGTSASLAIEEPYCLVEELSVGRGGIYGSFHVNADYVTLRNCSSPLSQSDGFFCDSGAEGVSLISCRAFYAEGAGFRMSGTTRSFSAANCAANACRSGFVNCCNLSNCYVDGIARTDDGYWACSRVSSSVAFNCNTSGFSYCSGLTACTADGMGYTLQGFSHCDHLSACFAVNVSGTRFAICQYVDDETCNED